MFGLQVRNKLLLERCSDGKLTDATLSKSISWQINKIIEFVFIRIKNESEVVSHKLRVLSQQTLRLQEPTEENIINTAFDSNLRDSRASDPYAWDVQSDLCNSGISTEDEMLKQAKAEYDKYFIEFRQDAYSLHEFDVVRKVLWKSCEDVEDVEDEGGPISYNTVIENFLGWRNEGSFSEVIKEKLLKGEEYIDHLRRLLLTIALTPDKQDNNSTFDWFVALRQVTHKNDAQGHFKKISTKFSHTSHTAHPSAMFTQKANEIKLIPDGKNKCPCIACLLVTNVETAIVSKDIYHQKTEQFGCSETHKDNCAGCEICRKRGLCVKSGICTCSDCFLGLIEKFENPIAGILSDDMLHQRKREREEHLQKFMDGVTERHESLRNELHLLRIQYMNTVIVEAGEEMNTENYRQIEELVSIPHAHIYSLFISHFVALCSPPWLCAPPWLMLCFAAGEYPAVVDSHQEFRNAEVHGVYNLAFIHCGSLLIHVCCVVLCWSLSCFDLICLSFYPIDNIRTNHAADC